MARAGSPQGPAGGRTAGAPHPCWGRRTLAAGTKTQQWTQTKEDGDGEEGRRGSRGLALR